MTKLDVTDAEIETLYRLFMEHPSGAAKKKLHVVYLKALGLSHQDIIRIARVSGDSVTRYVQAYVEGGAAALCTSQYYCPASALLPHRDILIAHFKEHPPHTVAHAALMIEKLTGIPLGTQRLPRLYPPTPRHELPQNGHSPFESRSGQAENLFTGNARTPAGSGAARPAPGLFCRCGALCDGRFPRYAVVF